MKAANLLVIPALLCATAVFGQAAPKLAHSDIFNAQGQKIGTAKIASAKEGVKISVKVAQLPAGVHAIHIHTAGKCEGPAFTTAGGHFNPAGHKHGIENPEGAHAGDLPNFTVDAKGRGRAAIEAKGVTLGEGANSLFHEGGTALVIHEKQDDYKTDPAGNAGARISCGVIQK